MTTKYQNYYFKTFFTQQLVFFFLFSFNLSAIFILSILFVKVFVMIQMSQHAVH